VVNHYYRIFPLLALAQFPAGRRVKAVNPTFVNVKAHYVTQPSIINETEATFSSLFEVRHLLKLTLLIKLV